ncbi:hypothetical protein Taro_032933 [Colocasia esculenta]|uniref:Uncharacterized protein n=1 Tax=Colocasia esculenta TaxID=4460 RepID=A0A843VMJ8_COLES|nr:hypothetical protein [Colocasia esculenta]
MSVCYAKHQESILPRLTSTLGRSSPGLDRAPIAQALDQVLDRSPTLCRTNSVDTRSSGVDTMLQTQDKIMQNWSGSVDTSSDVGQCVDTSTGGVDTRSVFQKTFWVNWDSVSTLAQVVSTLEAFPEHHLGGFGTVCRH